MVDIANQDAAATLTNKTLTAPVLGGTITGTYTLGGTPTFPSAVVTLTGTQTLTNKTLTSPVMTAPTLGAATATSVAADTFTGTSSNIVVDTGTALTLTTAHNGKTITLDNAAAITVTVGTAVGAVGFACNFIQIGAGQVTFVVSSTTINPAATLKIAAQHGAASLVCYATNVFNLCGAISA